MNRGKPKKQGMLKRVARAIANKTIRPIIYKITRPGGNARAFFDGADSNRYTQGHFAPATGLDINAILRADLPTLRKWCRYEGHNNGYGRGIIRTLGDDIVGQGPRLQVAIPGASDDDTGGQEIEDAWEEWADGCDADGRLSFGEMLNLAVQQCPTAGEAFIAMVDEPTAPRGEVSLRLRLIESDRIATPLGLFATPTVRDGIKFDKGKPTHYMVLKNHPGDSSLITMTNPAGYDEVPVDKMVHLYRPERPNQFRGIPWLASALIPMAHLRRYTLATVLAAERAATITAGIYTDNPSVDVQEAEEFDDVEIPMGSALTLPAGYKIEAFKPEQPTATYGSFKGEMLDEIGRAINMPHNVIAGNSSGYNYASGRLDWQTYFRMIRSNQAWLARVATKIFRAWYAEYQIRNRIIRFPTRDSRPAVKWYWPGYEHVDPVKEANAQRIRLNSLSTTLEDEWAIKGQDWLRKLKQIAKERKILAELNLTLEDAAPAIIAANESEAAAQAAADAAEENSNEDTQTKAA